MDCSSMKLTWPCCKIVPDTSQLRHATVTFDGRWSEAVEATMIRIGTENLEQGDPLGLPWDIGEWVDKHELIAWIDAELEGIDWTNPTILEFEQKHSQFRPKMF